MTLNEYLEGEFRELEHKDGCAFYGDLVYECGCPESQIKASIRNFYITKLEGEVKMLKEMNKSDDYGYNIAVDTIIARKQAELKEIRG